MIPRDGAAMLFFAHQLGALSATWQGTLELQNGARGTARSPIALVRAAHLFLCAFLVLPASSAVAAQAAPK